MSAASRLNASPQAAQDGRGPVAMKPGACLECGGPLADSVQKAEFCGSRCRLGFNNRRLQRGAEIYDLFMALRHDRAVATAYKVWRLLNRLAAEFRREDRRDRAGRPSWRSPAEILARRPSLTAERLAQGRLR